VSACHSWKYFRSLSAGILFLIVRRMLEIRALPFRLARTVSFEPQTSQKGITAMVSKSAEKPAGKVIPMGNRNPQVVHQNIPLNRIKPNPDQVRQTWDTAKDDLGMSNLDRLAESIRNQGLLSALVVTPQNGHFQIICGERRFRAISNNNLMKDVPCVVVENVSPAKQLEMNIVENLQREDLTAIDEARAYKALMEKCGYTQAQLSKRLGISGAMVSYKLSLLDLSPGLQKQVAQGRISETDGRTIVQTVKRINGPEAPQQRSQAMEQIEKKVTVEPVNSKNGKVESPAVKRVAEEEVTRVAGSKALPQARVPKAAPAPAVAMNEKKDVSSGRTRELAAQFLSALKDVSEVLRGTRRALADKQARAEVIKHLLTTHPTLPSMIRSSLCPLDLVFGEAAQLIDQRAQKGKQEVKTQPQAKKEKSKSKAAPVSKKVKKG